MRPTNTPTARGELLNVLSKIRGLRVASHTSAFSFKGSTVDIPTVARKLDVATILEGSVRKFGKRVRITVQLVEVASDSHLWSETYDRELEDIFAVQDDIAQSVVKELRSAGEAEFGSQRCGEGGGAGRGRGAGRMRRRTDFTCWASQW
jgi:TolB-like protein